MSNFLYKLNLPTNPLKPGALEHLIEEKNGRYRGTTFDYNWLSRSNPLVKLEVESYIDNALIDLMKDLELSIKYIIAFGVYNTSVYDTPIHTDVENRNSMIRVPGGINWELTATTSEWRWYDEKYMTPDYSGPTTGFNTDYFPRNMFNGIRYEHASEYNKDTAPGHIYSTNILPSTPYLLRTDIPHSVHYTNPTNTRVSISIRFDSEQNSTWDTIVHKLRPLLIE